MKRDGEEVINIFFRAEIFLSGVQIFSEGVEKFSGGGVVEKFSGGGG